MSASVEEFQYQVSASQRENLNRRQKPKFRFALLFILALAIGFGAATFMSYETISAQNFQLQTSGISPLTEKELIDVARKSGKVIYWAGPITGYTYSLTFGEEDSAIIRYLPAKGGPITETDSQRAVATYPAPQAWEKSKVAAARVGITSYTNSDGSLVFFDGKDATSVFLAFPKDGVQIEIFDARFGQALSLALLVGQIQRLM